MTWPACMLLPPVPTPVFLSLNRLGLPTSSSQCITGGIVGVGLMEGFSKGVNWKMFGKQFMSWVSTLIVVGLAVAAIFAQVSAPRAVRFVGQGSSLNRSQQTHTCVHLAHPCASHLKDQQYGTTLQHDTLVQVTAPASATGRLGLGYDGACNSAGCRPKGTCAEKKILRILCARSLPPMPPGPPCRITIHLLI